MFKGRVFTKNDYERLCRILDNGPRLYQSEEVSVETLKREMRQSRLVDPCDIRPNIVTMNSRICLRNIGNGRKQIYSLTFPDMPDSEDSLSVFSRIGAQVIGNPIGTVVKVNHSGDQYLMIEDILYQPESAGDYSQ